MSDESRKSNCGYPTNTTAGSVLKHKHNIKACKQDSEIRCIFRATSICLLRCGIFNIYHYQETNRSDFSVNPVTIHKDTLGQYKKVVILIERKKRTLKTDCIHNFIKRKGPKRTTTQGIQPSGSTTSSVTIPNSHLPHIHHSSSNTEKFVQRIPTIQKRGKGNREDPTYTPPLKNYRLSL